MFFFFLQSLIGSDWEYMGICKKKQHYIFSKYHDFPFKLFPNRPYTLPARLQCLPLWKYALCGIAYQNVRAFCSGVVQTVSWASQTTNTSDTEHRKNNIMEALRAYNIFLHEKQGSMYVSAFCGIVSEAHKYNYVHMFSTHTW